MSALTRRNLFSAAAFAGAAAAIPVAAAEAASAAAKAPEDAGLAGFRPLFKPRYGQALWELGVAQWSLRDLHNKGELDNRDFGRFCKEKFGISTVEWVNGFFKDKGSNFSYLAEMKQRCDDVGVRTNLIMVDGEGSLGEADAAKRTQVVDNHKKWVVASKLLGGHAIRVNAHSHGSFDEQAKNAADGLRQLTEFARTFGITVCVENHGGYSSNKEWLVKVMNTVALPECGILPDFGNCGRGGNETERYSTIDAFMPFAQSVSVKSWKFNDDGSHPDFDLTRMMRIVNSHGWNGVCAIESEGAPGGARAVELTLAALKQAEKTLRAEMGI